MEYLKLENLSSYKIAYDWGNQIWESVMKWDYFAKDTLGKQLVRAVDSISANIAEGFGRHHKKDKIKFYHNARGSLYEAQDWLKKAKDRNFIKDQEYATLNTISLELPREINQLIKFTNEKLSV